ncbi:winged helix-turn-helix transcriptional regulator [Streptomyces sp. F63]|uniref:MarR family winged helix-turn-helix transcriptional regulator n=1 Tax=Streptomyces sp. F63 TaxID=2824887 RepID=UPI001B3820E1|nr:MarR family winged helix-turn-helix transcriptional regulator [Streptomyces sp. F63]MBQ0987923.1 winged helix-turn-helix transcriptional regulator [Streptomyces sp. F63]
MSLTSPTDEQPSDSRLHGDLHWVFARLKQGLATAETPVVREHGMSLWGYTVLMAIVDTPARSQLALAQAVSVDKSKLVLVLDELEAAALVRRRPDPADRRARIVEATAAGRSALDAARKDIEAIEGNLLDDLDPPSRDLLRTVLRRLAGAPVARIEDGRQADNACVPPPS